MKHRYTVEQVYLFYEKLRKTELDTRRFDAVCMANAMVYASPSYDKKDAGKKQRAWKSFVDSLDWDKLKKKSKLTTGNIKKSLSIPGVKIKGDK